MESLVTNSDLNRLERGASRWFQNPDSEQEEQEEEEEEQEETVGGLAAARTTNPVRPRLPQSAQHSATSPRSRRAPLQQRGGVLPNGGKGGFKLCGNKGKDLPAARNLEGFC